jgi:sulfur-carrier protein adenylyltransferase/sulfurtransferase
MATTHDVAADLPALGRDEILRYSRHLLLDDVGTEGQRRLKAARILLIGAGGLGSPAALYLAAAGVGTLGIVDSDVVDVTNLQRQVLHGTPDIGRPKVASATDRLAELNPHVHVERFETQLTSANALDIVREFDLVVDGSDNFPTRYLINDACVLAGRPDIYGSVFRFEGQASVFATTNGPCYRCLFREPPPPGLVPSCADAGVLGVLPGMVGTIQATEAVKLVLGIGQPLIGRLLLVDAMRLEFRTVQLRRDPLCPACGTRELRALIDYDAFCGLPPSTGAASGAAMVVPELSARELADKRARGDDFDLIDVREPHEYATSRIDGARLIPLGTLPSNLSALDPTREIVLMCRVGGRSARAAQILQQAGFARVWSLAGGLVAWENEQESREAGADL